VDLFDVVHQTITDMSIAGNYRVGYIEQTWLTRNGQLVDTRWRLEPYTDLSGYWQFVSPNGVQMGVTTRFPL
jgi:ribosome-associated toxin RatA of RatAB toxin-antitoxin module